MKPILYPFMMLAACGLALSITVHVLSFTGVSTPGGELVWGLHIGIFVVWLPTVIVSSRMTRNVPRKDMQKVLIAGCPAWMRRGLPLLFIYAILNFIVFMATTSGKSEKTNGIPSPTTVRGFSGHWMVFYGAAFAVIYSRIHAPQLYEERKCPSGHAVSPTDRFCPACGQPLATDSVSI